MTGETDASPTDLTRLWREPSLPQPGGRDPAPGNLALVQSFVNSHYDLEFQHGVDLFATPGALSAWLERRGLSDSPHLRLTSRDVCRAIAVREGLRSLASANGAHEGGNHSGSHAASSVDLNRAAEGATLEVRFTQDGSPRFVAGDGNVLDRLLATVLAIVAGAMLEGSWSRLKICPGIDCGWAFYDHSRNQTGRWCSMAVCGGRAKARAHYHRRRGGE